MNYKEKLIVALDYDNLESAIKTIDELKDEVEIFKVGLELFLNSYGKAVDYIHSLEKKVFLDLKFHDIPNTTFAASKFAMEKDVFIFNIHASAGSETMKKVAELTKNKNQLAIAVTVLTSLTDNDLNEMFSTDKNTKEIVNQLADLAYKSGLNGIVCSPLEAKSVKEKYGENFKTICPGVRPKLAAKNDQQRVMTPYEAIKNSCDYIVVGRPITKADNPKEAAKLVLEEIKQAIDEMR